MKRRTLIGLVFTLLLLAIALYLMVISLLARSLESEEEALLSQDPAFAAPAAENGPPNPYAGQIAAPLFDPMIPVRDFTLPSTTGADFTLSASGKPFTLIYFGYLSCPDYCPATMANLRRVFIALGAQANEIGVLFLTVDPERDNLDLLGRFVAAFDERFIGLRGADVQPIIQDFGVTAVRRQVESAMGYLVDHTTSVFVVDADLNLIARFPTGTDYEQIVSDLQALLGD